MGIPGLVVALLLLAAVCFGAAWLAARVGLIPVEGITPGATLIDTPKQTSGELRRVAFRQHAAPTALIAPWVAGSSEMKFASIVDGLVTAHLSTIGHHPGGLVSFPFKLVGESLSLTDEQSAGVEMEVKLVPLSRVSARNKRLDIAVAGVAA